MELRPWHCKLSSLFLPNALNQNVLHVGRIFGIVGCPVLSDFMWLSRMFVVCWMFLWHCGYLLFCQNSCGFRVLVVVLTILHVCAYPFFADFVFPLFVVACLPMFLHCGYLRSVPFRMVLLHFCWIRAIFGYCWPSSLDHPSGVPCEAKSWQSEASWPRLEGWLRWLAGLLGVAPAVVVGTLPQGSGLNLGHVCILQNKLKTNKLKTTKQERIRHTACQTHSGTHSTYGAPPEWNRHNN